MLQVITTILSYIVGSFPVGYWFCKFFFDLDIMRHGSGNIGATNVSRVLKNKKYFVLIFLLDSTKAYAILWFCQALMKMAKQPCNSPQLTLWAFGLLIGNAHSFFLDFKGGKGVSTTIAILMYLMPIFATLFIISISGMYLIFSRVDSAVLISISSITSIYFVTCIYRGNYIYAPLFVFMMLWIFYCHRDNIDCIVRGIE